jgi:aspartyl protease family protein
MKPTTLPRLLCALPFVTVLTLTPAAVQAQSVAWAGTMGERVVLVIDGRARVAGAGSVIDGVRVHRVGVREVEYEVGGVRQTLAAGGAAVAVGDGAGRVPRTLVLRAGADQLYHVDCRVNGRPVAGVVDTGASQVSMSTARAAALGLDWSRGRPVAIQTANGQVRGWSVRLERLAVGAMEAREVEAVVLESELPHLLIGNSFLRRFQVVTQDSQLTLARAN